jgi:hypothetical protein
VCRLNVFEEPARHCGGQLGIRIIRKLSFMPRCFAAWRRSDVECRGEKEVTLTITGMT